jgi:membrane protease YdiL (CAAX protease family)
MKLERGRREQETSVHDPQIRITSDLPRAMTAATRRPLIDIMRFAAITVAISWVPWAVLGLTHTSIGSGVGFVVFAVAASGPSLAALIMFLSGSRRLPRRVRFVWWLPIAGILLGAAPAVVAAVCTNFRDLGAIPEHATATIASVGGVFGALAYTLISGPISEEFGWRGFLQPRLLEFLSPMRATFLIAACWGAWHVPLFFLAGTGQHELGVLQGCLFFVDLVPLSYLMLLASERLGGGVWVAIAIHAAWNLSEALMPSPSQVASVVETLAFFVMAAGAGVFIIRKSRKGYDR